jgi:hypothetical protein
MSFKTKWASFIVYIIINVIGQNSQQIWPHDLKK